MKKIKFYAAMTFVAASLLTACSNDDAIQTTQDEVNVTQELTLDAVDYGNVPSIALPEDVKAAIEKINLNVADFSYEILSLPNGEEVEMVVYEDILVRKEEFISRANIAEDNKQYSTDFIVDVRTFRTVDLFVYTGPEGADGTDGLTPASVAGVSAAVENWNGANSGIQFTMTVSDNPADFNSNFETLVVAFPINASGQAEFPLSNGAPGTFAVIARGLNDVAQFVRPEALEHLFTHELGHSIGFRHSDWDTRRTCVDLGLEFPGQFVESPAPRIFGTPPTASFQPNSVMNACFDGNVTNGNPNNFDKFALKVLYGRNFPF